MEIPANADCSHSAYISASAADSLQKKTGVCFERGCLQPVYIYCTYNVKMKRRKTRVPVADRVPRVAGIDYGTWMC